MTIHLVTGGAGFIGSHLTHRLVEQGDKVRVLDNLMTGSASSLSAVRDRVEFVEGDIQNSAVVARAVEGVECVFHLAALPSIQRSIQFPLESESVNAMGTLRILEAARETGVRRVIYASSSSVYGDTPTLPKREDQTPKPISPYAVSKLIGERYCEVYHALHGLETVSLRYFNVFGPRQDSDSPYAAVIPLFIQSLFHGQRPRVFGDGEQTRDFTFVSNAVDANLCAASAEGAPGRVFNVACQQRTSLNELLRIIGDIGGVFPQAEYADSRAGDVRDSLADIGQAREVLGYAPATTLVQGLEETYEWYRGERERMPERLNQPADAAAHSP